MAASRIKRGWKRRCVASMADRLDSGDKQEIIRWIRGGATANGYEKVQPIFEENCVACHRAASGLPVPALTTFEEVQKVTQVDTGASISQLARVSHVHLFRHRHYLFVDRGDLCPERGFRKLADCDHHSAVCHDLGGYRSLVGHQVPARICLCGVDWWRFHGLGIALADTDTTLGNVVQKFEADSLRCPHET